MFNQNAQLPFNMDDEVETLDLQHVFDGFSNTRGPKHADKAKAYRQQKPQEVEEEEPDPDWIEFDPEKERGKFFGHVMQDEEKLRERV